MADVINKKISLLPLTQSLNNGINYLAVTMATGAAKKNVRIPQGLIRQNILGWLDDTYTGEVEKANHANVLAYTNWLCTMLSNEITSYTDTKASQIYGYIQGQVEGTKLPKLSHDVGISVMHEAYLSIVNVSDDIVQYVDSVSTGLSNEITLEHNALTETIETNSGNIETLQSNISLINTNINTDIPNTYATKTDLNEHIESFNNFKLEYEDLSGKVAATSADVATPDHLGRVKLGYDSNPDEGYYGVTIDENGNIYVQVTNSGGGSGTNIPQAEWNAVSDYVKLLKPRFGESGELYDELSTKVFNMNLESLATRFNTYSDFGSCEQQYDLVTIDKSFDYNAVYRCYVATSNPAPAEYGADAKMMISAAIVEAKSVNLDAGTYVPLNAAPLETMRIEDLDEYTVIREFMVNTALSNEAAEDSSEETENTENSEELTYVPSNLYVVNAEHLAIDKTNDYIQASMVMPYNRSFEEVVTYVVQDYSVLNRLIELKQDILYLQNDVNDVVEMSAVNIISSNISLTANEQLTVDLDVSLTTAEENYIAISMPKILASDNIEIASIQMFNDFAHIAIRNTSSSDINDASLTATVIYADMEV